MHERQADPFFEQLKTDIREGLAAAERSDVFDADEVWREYGLIDNAGSRVEQAPFTDAAQTIPKFDAGASRGS